MYESWPKIDLHLHLDGALRPRTVWELVHEKNIDVGTDSFEDFLKLVVVSPELESVNEYLKLFELPLQVLQDAPSLSRVTYELIEDLAAQNHIYAEIRFAPQLHTRKGLTQRDAIEAVLAGKHRADEDFPQIKTRVILCMMCVGPKELNWEANEETARIACEYLDKGVAAIDLAGAEGIQPLSCFAPLFDIATRSGVPFTCHAGDSPGPETVEEAMDMGAVRIGHGHHVYFDPEVSRKAVRKQVTFEICPTSNIQCSTEPSYPKHPAKNMLDMGMRVTINTDNSTIADTTVAKEYEHCVKEMGFEEKDLITMLGNSVDGAFLPEEEKEELRKKLRNMIPRA